MTREAFMPLFFGDFLASTTLWEGEEQALYLLLLAYQWSSGPLPDEPARIAKVVRYDGKRFLQLWRRVGQKFDPVDGGLVNPRLEEHRLKTRKIAEARAQAGTEGGHVSAAHRASKDRSKPASKTASKPTDLLTANEQPNEKQNSTIHPIPYRSDQIRSDVSPVGTSQDPCVISSLEHAQERARASPDVPTPEQILSEYPHTPNGSKTVALHLIAVLIDSGEATATELLEGTCRFRRFVEAGGRSDPSKVQGPEKFYIRTKPGEPAPWAKPWTAPTGKSNGRKPYVPALTADQAEEAQQLKFTPRQYRAYKGLPQLEEDTP